MMLARTPIRIRVKAIAITDQLGLPSFPNELRTMGHIRTLSCFVSLANLFGLYVRVWPHNTQTLMCALGRRRKAFGCRNIYCARAFHCEFETLHVERKDGLAISHRCNDQTLWLMVQRHDAIIVGT